MNAIKTVKSELPAGHLLRGGKYKIEQKLGSGGFGITYKAICKTEIRYKEGFKEIVSEGYVPVAIKELFIEGKCIRDGGDHTLSLQNLTVKNFDHFRKRFLQEAEILSRLHDVPQVVQVVDYFEENNTAYMVMTFVEGETLSNRVKSGKLLSTQESRDLLKQALEGLREVHSLGMLHRDISPDNFMITPDDRVVLIDFGAAREFVKDKTHAVSILLKHGYAPKEQYSHDKRKGPWSDLYALGVTIWYGVIGKKPVSSFERNSDDYPFYIEQADPGFNNWIQKATHFEGSNRFQTVDEALDALNLKEKVPTELTLEKPATGKEIPPTVELEETQKQSLIEDHHTIQLMDDLKRAEAPTIALGQEVKEPTRQIIPVNESGKGKKKWKSLVLLAVLILALASSAFIYYRHNKVSTLLRDGWEYHKKGDHKKAYDLYTKASEYNSGKAYYLISWMNHYGLGTPKDYNLAVDYAEKAIDKGFDMAYYRLGVASEYGWGLAVDSVKANRYYTKAFDHIQDLSEEEDEVAQYLLGYYYQVGMVVEEDDAKALNIYEKAARQGNPHGMSVAADMYRLGEGTAKDYAKAREWYNRGIELEDARSYYGLAGLYYNGEGVERDREQAFEYFKIAAEKDYTDAQSQLGYMYAYGLGVEENDEEAVWWYRKAAEKGNVSGQYNLGVVYAKGEGISQDLDKAAEWYRKAARKDYSLAQHNLAGLYNTDLNNIDSAKYWYRKAAGNNYSGSQYVLGYYYEKGEGGWPQNYDSAYYWYNKASAQGNEAAQNNLGWLYYNGTGVGQDYSKAVDLFKKAAEQNYKYSQYGLGNAYYYGKGVEENNEEAFYWYGKAAAQDHSTSQYMLGVLYQNGHGTSKDYYSARDWYLRASRNGSSAADAQLAFLYAGNYGFKDEGKAFYHANRAAQAGNDYGQYILGHFYYTGVGTSKNRYSSKYWLRKACEQEEQSACNKLNEWF